MALRAAKRDESRIEGAVSSWIAWAAEVDSALDHLKSSGSMTWGTRMSQSVCAAAPAGEAVARNGAFNRLRVLRFHAGG